MYAVISDIHSNLAALTAVLADLDALGVRDVRCLGDVVGYGPDPLECVDLVLARAQVVVRGNHDEALVHGAYGFHLRAKEAIDWTRDQLKPGLLSGPAVRRRWGAGCTSWTICPSHSGRTDCGPCWICWTERAPPGVRPGPSPVRPGTNRRPGGPTQGRRPEALSIVRRSSVDAGVTGCPRRARRSMRAPGTRCPAGPRRVRRDG